MIRYDFALAVIPAAFVVSLFISTAVDLNPVQALVPAALVGILVIVDVCYRNPPTRDDA